MKGTQSEAMEKMIQAFQQDPSLKIKKWHTQIKREAGKKHCVHTRDFAPLLVDEPPAPGRVSEGPTPAELLIAAAGSCFAITFEMLANQRGLALDEVTVDVNSLMNAAVFMGLEEGEAGVYDTVITLRTVTSADKAQIEEIAKAALAKSPVLASLKSELRLILA